MPFIVSDKDGNVVAVADNDHVVAPFGGAVKEVSKEQAETALDAMLKPRLVKANPPIKDLKQLRRDKMRAIGDASVEGRGRVFKEFPHIHMMDQHRHIDVLVMYARGKLKDEDTILTRHLKSGEYENVKVGDLLDEIEKTFWLRQELRKHDQQYRDKINKIYKDPKRTDEQKMAEMEAVAVPPRLGVSTDSTVAKLILEKK